MEDLPPVDDLTALLEQRARLSGGDTAVIWKHQRWSYGDLLQASRALAVGLQQAGLEYGDRVGFWLPPLPAYLALMFACARLGILVVAINTRFGPNEAAGILRRTKPKMLAWWPGCPHTDFRKVRADLPDASESGTQLLDIENMARLEGKASSAPLLGDADSDSHTFTTSGTTSAPKLVLHKQHSLTRHAQDVAHFFRLTPESRVYGVLPLCGVFGMTAALGAIAGGAPLVLADRFDAAGALADIQQHGITHSFMTDDMIHRMLQAGADRNSFASVKQIGFAAFNTSLADLPAQADQLGLNLTGLYGMSECCALFAGRNPGTQLAGRSRAGGRCVSPLGRARVRDADSGELLPAGQPGALEVTGPSLMHRYLENDMATEAALTPDGWLRTGDLGQMEADGGFAYLGRMGDSLRLGGYLVEPSEIETVLIQHPAIADAQVVAVGTDKGNRPVAFVIPGRGSTPQEHQIMSFCRDRLAIYKVPVRVIFVDAFPVTESANGTKIQRAKLRSMAEDELKKTL